MSRQLDGKFGRMSGPSHRAFLRTQEQYNALIARNQAWAENPTCAECGGFIAEASRAAIIVGADANGEATSPRTVRVVHTSPCFREAVAKLNPTLSAQLARTRDVLLGVDGPDDGDAATGGTAA